MLDHIQNKQEPHLSDSRSEIRMEPSWKAALSEEFEKSYMRNLRSFLRSEIQAKKTIYPRPSEYFAAFDATPVANVKVVILGQDPYHGPQQAHGLCFSVRPPTPPPPSLQNIFKELKRDLNFQKKFQVPNHGDLSSWAKQGVLLLNATLSVEGGMPGSHQNKGWEEFTDSAIKYLNTNSKNIVFLLWGSYAQKKGAIIDTKKHFVLTAPHPSPLSAYRGFIGCGHFSKANAYLSDHGRTTIDWTLPQL